jgi:uncharacterized protein with HEPN domain
VTGGSTSTIWNLETFRVDERTYDAVVRNLEIIGEAAKHVPDDLRRQVPGIDWRKVAAFRDVLAHAYHGIDDDVLWDVVREKVPALASQLTEFLSRTPA